MKLKQLAWLAVVLPIGRSATGCDLCSVYAANEAQGTSGEGFFGGLAEQFTYFNTFQSNGQNAVNPDAEHLSSLTSQIFVGYNIRNNIGVQLNVPILYKEYARTGAQGSEAGLGDMSLLGSFRFYNKLTETWTFNWAGLAGIKFPTGGSSHLNPAEEDFAAGIGGHDLTLGSGSFDGLLGTGVFGRWRRLFATANVQYAIRSEGAFGYQFANDWNWFGGPGVYAIMDHDQTLAVQLIVSGESKGEDTRQGIPTDDTAETIVYLGPQISYTWTSQLSAQIGADFPVSVSSSGEQVVPSWRIHAAITFRF